MVRQLLIFVVLLCSTSISTGAEPLSAAQMERMILGSWTETIDMDGFVVSGVARYSADHTVEHVGSVVATDVKVDFRFRSKWMIVGDILITEVLETNQPEFVVVGDIERDKILSMTKDQWTYRDSEGFEVTAIRLREPSP